MTKRQSLSIVNIVCYLITIASGLYFAFSIKNELAGLSGAEGDANFGIALSAAILGVLVIFSYIYAAAAVLPLILKIINIFVDSSLPAVLAMLFDIAYILVNILLVINVLSSIATDGITVGFVALILLLLVSVGSLISNVVSMFD